MELIVLTIKLVPWKTTTPAVLGPVGFAFGKKGERDFVRQEWRLWANCYGDFPPFFRKPRRDMNIFASLPPPIPLIPCSVHQLLHKKAHITDTFFGWRGGGGGGDRTQYGLSRLICALRRIVDPWSADALYRSGSILPPYETNLCLGSPAAIFSLASFPKTGTEKTYSYEQRD